MRSPVGARMKSTVPPPKRRDSGRAAERTTVPKLVLCVDDVVQATPLAKGATYTIGRDGACDLVVQDHSVSRKHARLRVGRHVELEDLGSRNGTRVDGRLLTTGEHAVLRVGTIVQLGSVTAFVLNDTEADEEHTPTTSSASWRAAKPVHTLEDAEIAPGFVLKDERMIALYRGIRAIAESNMPVLILGETGVGKEVFAHCINARSSRHARPFVKFNAAALPESLVESELFGHVRGAFTGADKAREGLFEAANGGTLFLDEVGELSLQTQAKLLRVIETGELFRVGATKPITVDVRVISATNRDLPALMAARQFRTDLFYRLNGVTIHIPPLRDRAADIPALTEFFALACVRKAGKPAPDFSAEAMASLCSHRWPGNARELKNVVERAVLVASPARVEVEHLHLKVERVQFPEGDGREITEVTSSPDLSDAVARVRGGEGGGLPAANKVLRQGDTVRRELAELERRRIMDALASTSGNQALAARLLGVSRRTLMNRLDALGIARPRKGRTSPED
jgi:transcriptional regulator with GAF, ATPase, and Fis domain